MTTTTGNLERYAAEKALPLELLRELGVREHPHGIVIPYLDEHGRLYGEAVRYMDGRKQRFAWPSGKERIPYLLWVAERDKWTRVGRRRVERSLWVVEGETDGITALLLGLRAVALPGATPSEACLRRLPPPPPGEPLWMVPHRDDAGKALAWRLAELTDVRVVELPPQCKDLNDLVRSMGVEAAVRWLSEQRYRASYLLDGRWRQPLPPRGVSGKEKAGARATSGRRLPLGATGRELSDDALFDEVVRLLEARGHRVVRDGREWRTFCIYHNDRNRPNLCLSREKMVFICRACGVGGTLRRLLYDLEML